MLVIRDVLVIHWLCTGCALRIGYVWATYWLCSCYASSVQLLCIGYALVVDVLVIGYVSVI